MGKTTYKIRRNLREVLLIGLWLFCSAGSTYADNSRFEKEITSFLASVTLSDRVYDFDHNQDGITDMSIYPLIREDFDLQQEYTPLNVALEQGELILREDPRNYLTAPTYGHVITAEVPHLGILGTNIGQKIIFMQVGQAFQGGGQGRGSRRGGVWGQSEGGRFRDAYGSSAYRSSSVMASLFDVRDEEFEVDVLCFEKGRSIAKSMRNGDSEFFSYAGMASPSIRKKIVLLPTQHHLNKSIEEELRKFNVDSRTCGLSDIFNEQKVKEIVSVHAVLAKQAVVFINDGDGIPSK